MVSLRVIPPRPRAPDRGGHPAGLDDAEEAQHDDDQDDHDQGADDAVVAHGVSLRSVPQGGGPRRARARSLAPGAAARFCGTCGTDKRANPAESTGNN